METVFEDSDKEVGLKLQSKFFDVQKTFQNPGDLFEFAFSKIQKDFLSALSHNYNSQKQQNAIDIDFETFVDQQSHRLYGYIHEKKDYLQQEFEYYCSDHYVKEFLPFLRCFQISYPEVNIDNHQANLNIMILVMLDHKLDTLLFQSSRNLPGCVIESIGALQGYVADIRSGQVVPEDADRDTLDALFGAKLLALELMLTPNEQNYQTLKNYADHLSGSPNPTYAAIGLAFGAIAISLALSLLIFPTIMAATLSFGPLGSMYLSTLALSVIPTSIYYSYSFISQARPNGAFVLLSNFGDNFWENRKYKEQLIKQLSEHNRRSPPEKQISISDENLKKYRRGAPSIIERISAGCTSFMKSLGLTR